MCNTIYCIGIYVRIFVYAALVHVRGALESVVRLSMLTFSHNSGNETLCVCARAGGGITVQYIFNMSMRETMIESAGHIYMEVRR